MTQLEGRVAIVTGAGQGLGKAIARSLAEAGATVVVSDIDEATCGHTAQELCAEGLSARAFHLDVTDSDAVEALVDCVEANCGELCIVVNNAGLSRIGDHTHNVTNQNWHDCISVMQHGVFYMMRAAGRIMLPRGRGSIVNITSIRAFAVKLGTIEYSAPKAAMLAMTKTAAAEWGRFGVRVNAIAPGPLATEMTIRDAARGAMDEPRYLAAIPAARWGKPEEVGSLVVYLSSDEAAYINGSIITIDGGLTTMGPDGEFSAAWPADGPEIRDLPGR